MRKTKIVRSKVSKNHMSTFEVLQHIKNINQKRINVFYAMHNINQPTKNK